MQVFLEADAPRVRCAEHGVVVAQVPWARHGAGHTLAFDDTVAWLVTQCSKTAVTQLMRIAWRTVGAIIARVWADVDALGDRLDGLRRIGIDEISYKRGHRYLTVVVDHDTGRLVWAAPGRDRATLRTFFDAARPRALRADHPRVGRSGRLDRRGRRRALPGRGAVRRPVPRRQVGHRSPRRGPPPGLERRPPSRADRGPQGLRRRASPPATPAGSSTPATRCGRTPRTSPTGNATSSTWIAKTDPRLYRAYLLKEGLRYVFAVKGEAGKDALDRWLSWARRCRIPAFVHLATPDRRHPRQIDAALDHGLSNALIESINTKIRLLTRIAFGFRLRRRPHRPRHAQPRRPPTRPTRPHRPTDQSVEP